MNEGLSYGDKAFLGVVSGIMLLFCLMMPVFIIGTWIRVRNMQDKVAAIQRYADAINSRALDNQVLLLEIKQSIENKEKDHGKMSSH